MEKDLILLAGTVKTKDALHEQLKELFGDFINIISYATEEYIPELISDHLVVYSSYLIEPEVNHIVDSSCNVIIARRTMNYKSIDRLFDLDTGTQVLGVNDFPETTQEMINTLKKIGINHIEYVPFLSDTHSYEGINVAVTPGETDFVPAFISETIDIGVRLIDITTLIDILDRFTLKDELGGIISNRYTKKIIELSQRLSETNKMTSTLNQHLKRVVDGVNDGIIALDSQGNVSVFNRFMEEYTNVPSHYAIGKPLNHVLKHQGIVKFLSKKQEDGQYFTLNHFNLMVYRFQLDQDGTIIAIFKNTDETITMEKAARRKLMDKGYIAKYTFEDIIGKSRQIQKSIGIAEKLAAADFPILIQGESGTGKELFASSIHNHSQRKHEPFLAVNFSALPEDLLESELFGYEEGSFTGAKKGGKKGLFEQADGGTIFLDEIGDISLKLQARLLRVIQEMEIRRIGGNKNIPVNVRIVAATNKNLSMLIQEGTFREDLYYRLKVLFFTIPPLRERKNDILLLAEHFISEHTSDDIRLSEQVAEELKEHEWHGNIRELKNAISYMIAVAEGDTLLPEHLPEETFSSKASLPTEPSKEMNLLDKQMDKQILSIILKLNEVNTPASRKKIMTESQHFENPLTDQQIRRKLQELKQRGYVTIGRGRSGTNITEAGIDYLENEK